MTVIITAISFHSDEFTFFIANNASVIIVAVNSFDHTLHSALFAIERMLNFRNIRRLIWLNVYHFYQIVRLLRLALVKVHFFKAYAVAKVCAVLVHHDVRNGERMPTMQGLRLRIKRCIYALKVGAFDIAREHLVIQGCIDSRCALVFLQ